VKECLQRAFEARAPLRALPKTNAYRLFHGFSEGLPGLSIDLYGTVLRLQSHGVPSAHVLEAASFMQSLLEPTQMLLLSRGKPPQPLLEQALPNTLNVVCEHGLHYGVELLAPRNPGLYLDARPARHWLAQNSEGRHVLNLYSFAGSLGVAAMAGGAKSVTHVDTQKRALQRCRDNHKRNQQHMDARDLRAQDVNLMLAKAAKHNRRFGGIIVDPPPSDGTHHTICSSLAPALAPLLAPGAWVLCFFHHSDQSWNTLEQEFMEALGRPSTPFWRSQSGIDFPEPNETRDLRLSAFRLP